MASIWKGRRSSSNGNAKVESIPLRKWKGTVTSHVAAALSGAAAAATFAWLYFLSTEWDGTQSNEQTDSTTATKMRTKHGIVLPPSASRIDKEEKYIGKANNDNCSRTLSFMSPRIPITIFRPNPNLEIAFDARTKNPLYVSERLGGDRDLNGPEGSKIHRADVDDTDNDGKNPNSGPIMAGEMDSDSATTTTATTKRLEAQAARHNNHKSTATITPPPPATAFSSTRSQKMKFYEEPNLPPNHRSRNAHYRNSGYDRGHLAPAADFALSFRGQFDNPKNDCGNNDAIESDYQNEDNHQRSDGNRNSNNNDTMMMTMMTMPSRKMMRDTFSLCNTSPQASTFNRTTWARLERLVRNVALEEWKEHTRDDRTGVCTCVITGPLWLPSEIIPSGFDNDNDFGRGSSNSSSGRSKRLRDYAENGPYSSFTDSNHNENNDNDATTTTTTTTTMTEMERRAKKDKYLYQYEGIGCPPSLISVPTHFFKVVAVVVSRNDDDDDGDDGVSHQVTKFAAFVLPNTDQGEEEDEYDEEELMVDASSRKKEERRKKQGRKQMRKRRNKRLDQYLVRLSDLETVSGLTFFPNIWPDYHYHGNVEDDHDSSSTMENDPRKLVDALTEQIWLEQEEKRKRLKNDDEGDIVISKKEMIGIVTNGDGGGTNLSGKARRRQIHKMLSSLSSDNQNGHDGTVKANIQHICADGRCR